MFNPTSSEPELRELDMLRGLEQHETLSNLLQSKIVSDLSSGTVRIRDFVHLV